MKILRGGSAEAANNKWVKFDVELDESDLQAETIKYNLDLRNLSVVQKFSLLSKLAELLVTVRMEDLGVRGEKTSQELNQSYKDYISSLPKGID